MTGRIALAAIALALAPAADAASQPTLAGTWQRLPQTPASASIPYDRVGVWTGKQVLVFGRTGTPGAMRNAAFSYTPATRRWRTLAPPRGPTGSYEGALAAVWTGKLVLVVGPSSRSPTSPRRTAGGSCRQARTWALPAGSSSGPARR